jgi:hypothetical protein
VKACAGTNTQLVNTTDTSLSCGPQGFYWEIINYFDNYCGKSLSVVVYKRNKCFSKDPVINFITPGTYYFVYEPVTLAELKLHSKSNRSKKKPPVITLDPIGNFVVIRHQ